LVYAAAGSLRAIGFDLAHLATVGTARPVAQVMTTSFGSVHAAVASDGTLAYVSGSQDPMARTLVWVDRDGRETPLTAPPRAYSYPRISPDGTQVVVSALDQDTNMWLWNLARTTLTRLTRDPVYDTNPVWTPDGRRVLFSSSRAGAFKVFRVAADGTGAVERLTDGPNIQAPTDVWPDGTHVLLTERSPTTGQDVMMLRLDRPGEILPLVQTPANERNGIASPDGQWLAYEADDSGSFQVYVRPLPNTTGGRWQVSTGGGTQPLWSWTGQELFFFASNGVLMRATVPRGAVWQGGAPTKVLEARYVVSPRGTVGRNYDMTADGQRFLMLKAVGGDATGSPPEIVVVQHFDEELKRLVPVK
jgi:serine/threonine-protein kinase